MTHHMLIRTDASAVIGTGHAMRCLSLARAVRQDGGKTTFLCAEMPPFLREEMEKHGCSLLMLSDDAYGMQDAKETLSAAEKLGAAWIVLDGYSFDASYRKALHGKGPRVLAIQDFASAYGAADLILNQNIGAEDGPEGADMLLGPQFALLRPEFAERKKKEAKKNADHILVTLGGADPLNATGKIIEALAEDPPEHVTVVVGGAHPNRTELQRAAQTAGFVCVTNAGNMHQLMAEADLAIASGGTTTYELACMGVPMLLTVLAENQREVASEWERAGAAMNLGWHNDLTPGIIQNAVRALRKDRAKRAAMSERGQSLVDGYGALRVNRALTGDPLWLRDATMEDCLQVLAWANDPETRAVSFMSTPIAKEDHVRWFTQKIASAEDRLFIAMDQSDRAAGLVRFSFEGKRAVISINLAPEFRGKGLGTALIVQGCRRLFATSDTEEIDAFIKPENAASEKAFSKAGFHMREQTKIQGQSALQMTLSRATMHA